MLVVRRQSALRDFRSVRFPLLVLPLGAFARADAYVFAVALAVVLRISLDDGGAIMMQTSNPVGLKYSKQLGFKYLVATSQMAALDSPRHIILLNSDRDLDQLHLLALPILVVHPLDTAFSHRLPSLSVPYTLIQSRSTETANISADH